MALHSDFFTKNLRHYRVHILVFFVALFVAITFAHPSILITDEWITTNQLTQLQQGHQVIFNEGKYGSYENGTPVDYFTKRQNYLPYPLFLPLISLPSELLVTFFGNEFVFVILYLWTFLLIVLALLLDVLFPEYSYVGRWRWTTGMIIGTFVLFFINLYFYFPYSLTGKDGYPEIMAIVFTNCILFAFLAVLIFETCRTIFEDQMYSFFGTLVCLSCSSYLFWSNFCKDHLLVAFLVTAIILLLVKFLLTDNSLFLSGSFVISGLLAWTRPELALLLAFVLCIPVVYSTVLLRNQFSSEREWLLVFVSPVFTLVGAIPFFINNYLVTHNIFLPAFIHWNTETTSSPATIADTITGQENAPDTLGSLLHLIQTGTNIQPSTFLSDVLSVFFNPHSGSIGVLPFIPLFISALILMPVVILREKKPVTDKEKKLIAGLLLIAGGIFFAYVRGISGMNISHGIVPDMRYLSPIYLPLTLIGLMVIRKIPAISRKPLNLIVGMISVWIILIPLSLIAISRFFPIPKAWEYLFPPLNFVTTLVIYILTVLFVIFTIYTIIYKKPGFVARCFLVILCTVPLIWQIDATFLARLYGNGLGGYSFWIPVVLKMFEFIF